MLAVRGYYDGEAFQPLEDITLRKNQQDDINERLRIAESLYGIIPPDITLEESREERLSKI